jgi:hypothetical protein
MFRKSEKLNESNSFGVLRIRVCACGRCVPPFVHAYRLLVCVICHKVSSSHTLHEYTLHIHTAQVVAVEVFCQNVGVVFCNANTTKLHHTHVSGSSSSSYIKKICWISQLVTRGDSDGSISCY